MLLEFRESARQLSTESDRGLQWAIMQTKPDPQTPSASIHQTPSLQQTSGSRQRFDAYRDKVRQKQLPKGSIHSTGDSRAARDRVRSSWQLVLRFFGLLVPYRRQVIFALLTVTASTVLGLLPPAGTKFVIDFALDG